MATPIHYRKNRKSDFLAGVDLEIFQLEGRSSTLTISKVEFHPTISVNGRNKANAILVHFKEDYAKPWIVNSTNTTLIKEKTGIIDAAKWIGFSVQFYFDTSVVMKKEVVGGIRVKEVNTNGLVPKLEDIPSRIAKCTNIAELSNIWGELTEKQQAEFKDIVVEKNKTFK